jgi:hypothetical protein
LVGIIGNGNNWYGNNWGIPITITIASTPTTQVEEGPQIQILQIQTEATIQHREHFLTTEAAAIHELFERQDDTNRSSNTIDFRRGKDRERTNGTFNRSNTNQNESYNLLAEREPIQITRRKRQFNKIVYLHLVALETKAIRLTDRVLIVQEMKATSQQIESSSSSGRSSQGSSRRGGGKKTIVKILY